MINKRDNFESGEKVILLDGRTYDFGYIGDSGKAVIYEVGEMNMQDSIAVDRGLLKKLEE